MLLPCAAVYGEVAPAERAPQVPLAASFTLADSAEARDARLYLGQVATCAGAPEICEEAAAVDLGPAPDAGRSTFMTRAKLLDMLAAEWDGAQIEVKGADQVKITTGHVEIDADAVKARLADELAAAFDADARYAVAVEKVTLTGKAKLRPNDYVIDFPTLADLGGRTRDWLVRHLNGAHPLPVRFSPQSSTAGEVTQVTASVTFTLSERLPVTRRAMAAGEILTVDAFEEAWVVVGKGRQHHADKVQTLAGKRLKRPVGVGAPIMMNQLEVPAIVRRGELVTLRMSGDGVNVTGQVKALDDGGYGQAIEVMMMATKKRLRARVVDEDTVEYMR